MNRIVVIIGSGMMGSALAFPTRENGHEVRLVGTPLDREIIEACRRSGQHPKFDRPFPPGMKYYQFEEWRDAVTGADFVIGGVSSFGVDWFLDEVLTELDPSVPVLSVTKGLIDREDGSLISYPDYWSAKLSERGICRKINAIGGPCTSYELVYHDHSEVAFCGEDAAKTGDGVVYEKETVLKWLKTFYRRFFSQQDADLPGPAAVNGHIEVTDADGYTVFFCALQFQKFRHFPGSLVESARLGVEVQSGLGPMLAVHQADRHRDTQGIGILQRHRALQSQHIPRQGDMVVGGLHRLFHHP